MKTKNQNIIGAVLVVLIVSLVPLVVSAFKYETGMAEYAWFSGSTVRYDFFLFWKGQLLLLLCALMAFYAALKCLLVKEGMPDSKLEKKYIIPLALYAVLAFESTIFRNIPMRLCAAAMSSGKECLFWGRTWRYCSFRIGFCRGRWNSASSHTDCLPECSL